MSVDDKMVRSYIDSVGTRVSTFFLPGGFIKEQGRWDFLECWFGVSRLGSFKYVSGIERRRLEVTQPSKHRLLGNSLAAYRIRGYDRAYVNIVWRGSRWEFHGRFFWYFLGLYRRSTKFTSRSRIGLLSPERHIPSWWGWQANRLCDNHWMDRWMNK